MVKVNVNPGVCGFRCVVRAEKGEAREVALKVNASECKQVQRLAALVTKLSLRDLFAPVVRNPIFVSAAQAGCHASCPIPLAMIKAAEAAMEMALPRNVLIEFEDPQNAL